MPSVRAGSASVMLEGIAGSGEAARQAGGTGRCALLAGSVAAPATRMLVRSEVLALKSAHSGGCVRTVLFRGGARYMLRCHGELIAVPHAEGCTQWLLVVCRRAAYAVRLVLPFGLTLQQCCVVLLCVRKVRYPELGVGSLVRTTFCHQARARLERLRSVRRPCFRHPSSARPLAGPLVHICTPLSSES